MVKDKESKHKHTFMLRKLSDTPIERYVKIRKQANPFDQKTDNELWIVYEGSDEWTSVVSWDVYENEKDAEEASLLYPYKICFFRPEETVE
jgi:hypothetical protein